MVSDAILPFTYTCFMLQQSTRVTELTAYGMIIAGRSKKPRRVFVGGISPSLACSYLFIVTHWSTYFYACIDVFYHTLWISCSIFHYYCYCVISCYSHCIWFLVLLFFTALRSLKIRSFETVLGILKNSFRVLKSFQGGEIDNSLIFINILLYYYYYYTVFLCVCVGSRIVAILCCSCCMTLVSQWDN